MGVFYRTRNIPILPISMLLIHPLQNIFRTVLIGSGVL